MKKLTLKNKKEFVFSDTSTELDLVTFLDTFGEIDSIAEEMTSDNVRGAKLDRTALEYIVPKEITAIRQPNGKVEVHFINRELTTEEKQDEKILELQESVAALM
jgi:hypothetical protein